MLLAAAAAAQPFQPGTGFAPLGNLRTMDRDGPYNLILLPVQANEIRGGRSLTLTIRRATTIIKMRQATLSADLSGPALPLEHSLIGIVA